MHIFPPQGNTVFCTATPMRREKGLTRNKVEICGVDTSKLPVLKNEEMRLLFKQMQEAKLQHEKNSSTEIYDSF